MASLVGSRVERKEDKKLLTGRGKYTADVNFAFEALERIETGLCYINASTIGAEIQLPFGGIKGTGNGHRDAGSSMIDNCTEWKSCMVDYSGKVQKAQIDH